MSQEPVKFKLLELPSLAIEHVIRAMDLKEMFFFSLTSRKAKSILNYSFPKGHFHVKYSFWRRKYMILNHRLLITTNKGHNFKKGARTHRILGTLYKIINLHDRIEIDWDESFKVGMETLMAHFAESFHLPKPSVELGASTDPEETLALVNHAKSLNCPQTGIEMSLHDVPIEVYKAFLDVGPSIAQRLHIESQNAPNFQYRPSEVFKLDELFISDGRWVHLEDFMKFKKVIVKNWTNRPNMYCADSKKLNDFFKLWKASSYRLGHLQLDIHYNRDLSFEGITAELDGTNFIWADNFQSVEIQREDGRKAVIRMCTNELYLQVVD